MHGYHDKFIFSEVAFGKLLEGYLSRYRLLLYVRAHLVLRMMCELPIAADWSGSLMFIGVGVAFT